jgi:hypothetical protein
LRFQESLRLPDFWTGSPKALKRAVHLSFRNHRFSTLKENNMGSRNSMRAFVMMAIFSGVLVAQTQPGQQPPPQQQQQQQTQQQQAQPAQPAKKVSAWQRLRQAAQAAGVNTGQQGAQQTQQGVQQGAQQGIQGAQQSIDGAQQRIQQMTQGVQQQGVQQMVPGQGGAVVSSGSCGPSCFDAGPFQANVSQMTMSQQGYWHIIRMNVQFRNSSNQPLIIAYREGSMVMIDNNGSSYQGAGGNPGELQGMGIDRGNQTDSQFVLAPGQTGSAMFSVARARGNDSPIGTGFTYNLTIDELQAQNGAMAIPVRQYNLNFPSLTPTTLSAAMPSGGAGVPANNYVAGGKGAAIGAVPAGNVAARTGVAAAPARPGAMPAAQPRINGQPAATTPARGAMVPAALKSPVATAKPAAVTPAKPALVPARAAAVVPAKPAAVAAVKPAVKKTPAAAAAGTATK